VAWIFQREEKTFFARIRLVERDCCLPLPGHRREATKDITLTIQNDCQCIGLVIASLMEGIRSEPVLSSTPQKMKLLPWNSANRTGKVAMMLEFNQARVPIFTEGTSVSSDSTVASLVSTPASFPCVVVKSFFSEDRSEGVCSDHL
jgi:hypothetical protein